MAFLCLDLNVTCQSSDSWHWQLKGSWIKFCDFLRDLTGNKMRAASLAGLMCRVLKKRATEIEERPEADICPITHSQAVPRPLLRFNLPGYLSELRPVDLSCYQTHVSWRQSGHIHKQSTEGVWVFGMALPMCDRRLSRHDKSVTLSEGFSWNYLLNSRTEFCILGIRQSMRLRYIRQR